MDSAVLGSRQSQPLVKSFEEEALYSSYPQGLNIKMPIENNLKESRL